MSELVRIASRSLTATIAPLGAELQSLKDAYGREYMTDADPAFWAGHAPLLFPIVGRLRDDTLRLGGRCFEMKQHGFARKLEWELVGAKDVSVTFGLSSSASTREMYPYAFEICVEYALEDSTLSTTIRISNPGEEALPFSFGFHPAFAWPLPGGGDKAGHAIHFENAEPAPIRRLNEDGLVAGIEGSPLDRQCLALDSALFEKDAIIWDELVSRKLVYRGSDTGPALEITFPDMPHLGIWQKPGANFICIEPWAGHADPEGFAGEFTDKPGIIALAPGARRSLRMDVSVIQG